MNTFRQIPLHMILLAGLVGPLAAEDKPAPSARAAASAEAVAYAGLNVAARPGLAGQAIAGLPDDVGLQVGFLDPAGPSVGKIEEGDILTRLDDQVLFNAEQFRALVRMHKPGDKVKVTLVRGAEPQVVELTLGTRKVAREAAPARARARLAEAPSGSRTLQVGPGQVLTIGPDAVLPPEIRQQLEALGLAAGAAAAPAPRRSQAQAAEDSSARSAPPVGMSSSHSFSFSFGSNLGSSSHSMASDGDGSVSLEEKDGKKRAIIKDSSGKTLFDGEVTTPEQLKAMPAELRRRLKLVEGKGFTIPGFPDRGAPGNAAPAPAEEPKKFDPKQGA
jgi:hypothetical protein